MSPRPMTHRDFEGLMLAEIDDMNSMGNLDNHLIKALMSSPVCRENIDQHKKSRPGTGSSPKRPKTAKNKYERELKFMPEQILRDQLILTKTFTDFDFNQKEV